MNERILEHYLEEFQIGVDVTAEETETLFDALIGSEDQPLIAEVLTAWNEKGTTEDELFEFASLMRGRMKRVASRRETFVDIVGTGGSPAKTFNVSTAAAFVTAGAGLSVAKHGNRAATSSAGSADVLSALGINVDTEPSEAESDLSEHGLCFMFAPRFHSLSASLASAARRLVAGPTIFNNLGPLCNPAFAPHQIIGVCDAEMVEKTANVLLRLGAKKSWVVHGESGLDEIALKGKTLVAEIDDESLKFFEITAAEFGVYTLGNDLPQNCTADESATMIREILENKMQNNDAERLVLINAAAALQVAGMAADLTDAYEMAVLSVRDGRALGKLERMVNPTK